MDEQSPHPFRQHIPLIFLGSLLLLNTSLNLLNFRQFKNLIALHSPNPSSAPLAQVALTPTPAPSELSAIKDELIQIRADQRKLTQVLGSSQSLDNISDFLLDPDNPATQSVTITDPKFSTVDVHATPLASSKIVGQLAYGHKYPYIATQGAWFEVQILENLNGFVSTSLTQLVPR